MLAPAASIAAPYDKSYSAIMLRNAILLLLAIACLPLPSSAKLPAMPLNASLFGLFGGGKPQPPPGWVLHKQSASFDSSKLGPADRDCGNWGWAAGVVDMARTQGVRLNQQYLVDRLYGGSLCLDEPGDVNQLAQSISHDYILPDGQKFSLQAQFTPGAPTQADPLIVSVRQHMPLMLLWHNHAYLLVGLNWDEYIAPTGNKMFMINELRLFDPTGVGKDRELSFLRGRDNPDDLNGQLAITLVLK